MEILNNINSARGIVFAAFAFTFGAVIGSFLNVLIYRIPAHINPASGRSFCPECKTQLKYFDLVPIFSYLALKGKCRYCSCEISARYLRVELLTALVFVSIYTFYGTSIEFFVLSAAMSILLVISFIDYEHHYIPNYLTIMVLLLNAYFASSYKSIRPVEQILSGLVYALPFYSASLIMRLRKSKGFGMGDIKLAFALGLSIGIYYLAFALCLTCLVLFVKIFWYFVVHKNKRTAEFGFAGVLSASYFIYLLVSQLL